MKIPDNSKIILWVVIAVYAVIGLAIYSNVIQHGIFIFDDFEYVLGNDLLQNISFFNLNDPRQIGYLSFALNYALGGEDPLGYHLVNVIIHIANAVLAFFFIRLLLNIAGSGEIGSEKRHTAISFLTGLIFLVHPIETQAVSYITQRFTSLTTFFYLISVLSYLKVRARLEADGEGRISYLLYGLSFLSAVLAMRTKEIAFTIPIVIGVFEYLLFQGSKFSRRRFVFLIPFAALMLIIPFSILAPEMGMTTPGNGITEVTRKEKIYDLMERSPLEYLLTQFRVIVTYIRLLVLPLEQRVVYDYNASRTLFDVRVLFSLGILSLFLLCARLAWRKAKKTGVEHAADYKLISLGILWFFLTISIESSVIPIKDLIFEHRVYLPSIGFFALCSALIVRMLEGRMTTAVRRYVVFGGILSIVMSLAVATYIRNDVWTDEVRFWDDVVRKNPDKAIGYNNRGNAYGKIGQYELALSDINKTISFFPKDPNQKTTYENADFTPSNMSKTYMNRGNIYYYLGDIERGRADLDKARALISMDSRDFQSILGTADAFFKKGDYKYAIEEYNKVLQWDPENRDALVNRANAYSWTGNYRDAISDLSRIILLYPDFALAYHNRGVAYAWSNNKEKAVEDFTKACEMGFKPACDSIEAAREGKK